MTAFFHSIFKYVCILCIIHGKMVDNVIFIHDISIFVYVIQDVFLLYSVGDYMYPNYMFHMLKISLS